MRSIYIAITLLFTLLSTALSAQYQRDKKRDFQWVAGMNYKNHGTDTILDGFTLDFHTLPPVVKYQLKSTDFYLCNTNISDTSGFLQFYSTGSRIISHDHNFMPGGAEIEWGEVNDLLSDETGSPLQQSTLALPRFDSDSLYYLLYLASDLTGQVIATITNRMYMAEIDMSQNEDKGAVLYKDSLFLQDTFHYGKMTACRHANGRDWWLIFPRRDGNSFHRFLYDPWGFHDMGRQDFPQVPPVRRGSGNAVFSPDGTKYAITNIFRGYETDTTWLYRFDRCSGLLYNPVDLTFQDTNATGNLAFSPNSRLLYQTNRLKLYQYDTEAPDVKASRQLVAVADDYEHIQSNSFMQMQLAPDGKIYMSSRTSAPFIHRIEYPDRRGPDCQVCQHCIDSLIATCWALPSFPHYRLGPDDGSACDSLGTDNIPWARFNYAQESEWSNFAVQFTDLTAFEPQWWQWNFGDPLAWPGTNTSTLQHPMHHYSAPGVYIATLIAGNDFATDTISKKVVVLTPPTVATNDEPTPVTNATIRFDPNPAAEWAYLHNNTTLPRRVVLQNSIGQVVRTWEAQPGTQTILLAPLPNGLYFWADNFGENGVLIKKE